MRWGKDDDAILVVHQLGEVSIIDLDWESRNTVKGQAMIPGEISPCLRCCIGVPLGANGGDDIGANFSLAMAMYGIS